VRKRRTTTLSSVKNLSNSFVGLLLASLFSLRLEIQEGARRYIIGMIIAGDPINHRIVLWERRKALDDNVLSRGFHCTH
jgi:hypothetical protein